MSEMAVLDVGIGLMFMFVLLSLLVTTIQESLASLLRLRAKNLYAALDNLLADPKLAEHADYKQLIGDLYRHPLIKSLYRRSPASEAASKDFHWLSPQPSYIPSRTFAIALLDVLRGKTGVSGALGVDTLLADAERVVAGLPDGELKTTLGLFVNDAGRMTSGVNERADLVGQRIEQWFNDAMSRASGWYKRTAQLLSFAIALLAAVVLNADALHVADKLWHDSTLRAAVSASAQGYYAQHAAAPAGGAAPDAPDPGTVALQADYRKDLAALQQSSLPIGWSAHSPWGKRMGLALLGWCLTAFAASLGSAFWFDLLGRALQIRGSGSQVSSATGETAPRSAKASKR